MHNPKKKYVVRYNASANDWRFKVMQKTWHGWSTVYYTNYIENVEEWFKSSVYKYPEYFDKLKQAVKGNYNGQCVQTS